MGNGDCVSRGSYGGRESRERLSGVTGAIASSRAGGPKNPSNARFISEETPGHGVGASAVSFLRLGCAEVGGVAGRSSRAGGPKNPSNARASAGDTDE
jgi:hypothetical protein